MLLYYLKGKTASKSILRLYGEKEGLETKDPSELHIKGIFDFDKLLETARPIDITRTEHKWEIPVPMENIKPTSIFPVECLPNKFRRYVEAVAEDTQTPVDMASVAVLAVVSNAIQGKYEIENKKGHIEPLNVYCMEVAKPSERKSPVTNTTTKPIRAYEKIKNEEMKLIIAKQQSELRIKNARITKLETSGKIENIEEIERLQAEIRELEENQIKPLRFIADNTTLEALTSLLADNDGKISIISAEGGIFDILNGQYNNSKSSVSIDTLLKAYSGEEIRVDRKGRESEYISKPTMTIFLAVQEIVLEKFMSNDIFRGRGLNARFLYCIPTSKVGARKYRTEEISPIVEEEYNKIIYKLLDLPNEKEPRILKFSIEADKELEIFYNWIEPQLKNELEFMGDWAGKLFGNCLRIAGILHCMEYSNIDSGCLVSVDTVKKAITISKYFLEHSKYAYMLAGENKDIQKAKYILQKLKKQEKNFLKRSEIVSMCRSKNISKVDDIIEALNILVENRYIFELEPQKREAGKGGRNKDVVFELNPLYFKK